MELLDLSGLGKWIDRVEFGLQESGSQIEVLVRQMCDAFAKEVAKNPEELDRLEWRDLERMMARVMEGLGFSVTLTAPSKDKGKDLILFCTAEKGTESYVVEIKHWRSGKQVGNKPVSDFMQVIVKEKRAGGLFLSTSGYRPNAFEGITAVNRKKLRLGGKEKIVTLVETYVRAAEGLWSPPTELPEILFDHTE